MRVQIAILVCLFGLSACGGGVPQVTPTVAPTSTPQPTRVADEPTRTPVIRLTSTPTLTPLATDTPTPTATLTPTNTPTITNTPTNTATGTQTPTNTPTLTHTPTHTPTNTPTLTHTPTSTPTVTPLVFEDTDTPTPTDTATPTHTPTVTRTPQPSITPSLTPTATHTATFTPSATQTPNLSATENASILLTRAARPTFTAVPPATSTNTIPAPTQDVPPTRITATPGGADLGILNTPVPSTPEVQPETVDVIASPTPFTPTPFPLDQIPPTLAVQTRPQVVQPTYLFSNTTVNAYSFNVGSGSFIYNGTPLNGGVGLFASNPTNAASFVRTDTNGLLSFVPPYGGGEQRLGTTPFFDGFGNGFTSPQENKNYISSLAWSVGGNYFTFVIQPPAGTDNINAGVWYWDSNTGGAYPVMRDCPNDSYSSCSLILNRPASHWQSIGVEWSSDNRALITVYLPDEGRQAVAITRPQPTENITTAPDFIRYDNAQWLNGSQLLVSGRAPDGRSIIGVHNIDTGALDSLIFDATGAGLFIFDAVQRPNGQIIALGREGGFGGGLRLYRIENGQAIAISGYVGDRHPDRVRWAANYSEVVLTYGGSQTSISAISGAISQPSTGGAVDVGSGNSSGVAIVPPPDGVVANSRYNAGQTIRFIGAEPRNMRTQPSVNGGFVDLVNPGEFVTVLAGPYVGDGYEWWQVSNARNNRAWVSTHSADGFAFFEP